MLTEVVEENTKVETKHKKGSAFCDGWTNADAHCLALLPLMCRIKIETGVA